MPTFKAMAEAVSQLPADGGKVLTWPIVTLLPFLADPKRFIALKPTNTELMAARMDVRPEIRLDAELGDLRRRRCGWPHSCSRRLAPLGAKDMIDVQAFMWVTRDLTRCRHEDAVGTDAC